MTYGRAGHAPVGRRPVTSRLEHPVRLRLAGPLLALVLLTGCSAGAEPVADPGDDPVPTSALTSAPSPVAPSPRPAVRVIAVGFTGGAVTGVQSRVDAALGERLVLRVTSDVADEIHVHGYDERADVVAGGTVDLAFTADIPGGFEVELEGLGRALFQLRVA